MPSRKIKEFLDENKIKYSLIPHSPAFTAPDIAASAHISEREVAKVVILKVDGKLLMAVLPASFNADLWVLKDAFHATAVELADEQEFADLFPECEVGAMPPLGNLYGLDVVVAESLTEDEDIAFNAGSHRELIVMPYCDFERLVKPRVVSFGILRHSRRKYFPWHSERGQY